MEDKPAGGYGGSNSVKGNRPTFRDVLHAYRAAREDPTRDTRLALGDCLLNSGHCRLASGVYGRMVRDFGRDPELLYRWSDAEDRCANDKVAFSLGAEALALDPLNPVYAYAHASRLLFQHEYDAAVAAFRHSLECDPPYDGAEGALAVALSMAGRHPEAVVQIEKCCSEENASPWLMGARGLIYGWAGRPDEVTRMCHDEVTNMLRIARGLQELINPWNRPDVALIAMDHAIMRLDAARQAGAPWKPRYLRRSLRKLWSFRLSIAVHTGRWLQAARGARYVLWPDVPPELRCPPRQGAGGP